MFLSGNGAAISDPAAVPAAVIQGSARLPLSFLMGSQLVRHYQTTGTGASPF